MDFEMYEIHMSDARTELLTPSTRVTAAFHAIVILCAQLGKETLGQACAAIRLSAEDLRCVQALDNWRKPEPPPMSPDDAIALAERVRKNIGESLC
ncbi:hypothetical protein [Paraburkholderia atlantica]|uniref:hypothetical protein n=1 Tax=Paraburkholderia atlantica TaxID=2654982 RepID=UPI001D112505|nr:hypothetical protein [Paraburkholderia atlantica]